MCGKRKERKKKSKVPQKNILIIFKCYTIKLSHDETTVEKPKIWIENEMKSELRRVHLFDFSLK